jgi:hypothetical protein
MGHIINLIAEAYLFGQDSLAFERDFVRAGPPQRRELWRQRGAIGKLHNLVAHVMASGKRSALFDEIQNTENTGVAGGKIWKLLLDGGIRWNASYSMIRRAIELKEALNAYAAKLQVSAELLDREVFAYDFIEERDWQTLSVIQDHLAILFRATKDLEGNANLQEKAGKASYGALWECLPTFDHLLEHFEQLQIQASAGFFEYNPRIQQSITLAWQKTKDYYARTDHSTAWIAALVLHPRIKWIYLEAKWNGSLLPYLTQAKKDLKKLWEQKYKGQDIDLQEREEDSPVPPPMSMIEQILESVVPLGQAQRYNPRRDQYATYIAEASVVNLSVMDYWKAREREWPQLTAMAFDFLSIPAMSAECERVFSACSRMTTAQSSRLSGETLWYTECLKNWQNRGAIEIGGFNSGILLNLEV